MEYELGVTQAPRSVTVDDWVCDRQEIIGYEIINNNCGISMNHDINSGIGHKIRGFKQIKDYDIVNKDIRINNEEAYKILNNSDHNDRVNFLLNYFKPFLMEYLYKKTIILNSSLAKFNRRFSITNEVQKSVLPIVNELWMQGYDFVLAGGKAKNYICNEIEDSNDYDLFFTSDRECAKLFDYFERHPNYKITVKSHLYEVSNTETGLTLQLIRKIFGTVEHIIDNFDFLHCCVAIYKNNIFWIKNCIHAARNKELIFHNLPMALTQIIRTKKFISKGFTMDHKTTLLSSIGLVCSVENKEKHKAFLEDSFIDKSEEEINETLLVYEDWLTQM